MWPTPKTVLNAGKGARVAIEPRTAKRMASTTTTPAIRMRKTKKTNRVTNFPSGRCIVLPPGTKSSTDNTGTESKSAIR
jgi:hypothetical protein